jgi:hypothetical protein
MDHRTTIRLSSGQNSRRNGRSTCISRSAWHRWQAETSVTRCDNCSESLAARLPPQISPGKKRMSILYQSLVLLPGLMKIGWLYKTGHRNFHWHQENLALGARSRSVLIRFLQTFFIFWYDTPVALIWATSEGIWSSTELKRTYLSHLVHLSHHIHL